MRPEHCGAVYFEIFQTQFQLFNVVRQFLGTWPELHPLQFQDEQLQIVDLMFMRDQFGVLFDDQSL